jgi:2-methylisocitrate lyase-like PEP mutase family enzyme
MKRWNRWAGWLVAGALGLVGLTVGCESTDTEEVAILITSDAGTDEVQIGQITYTARLANSDTNSSESLVLPLVWDVAEPSLGRIIESAGVTAVYEMFDVGVQSISVEDQIGRKGVVGLTQLPPEEEEEAAEEVVP